MLLEIGVQRQDHERQMDVDHSADHRKAAEQQLEGPEHDHPCIDPHQEVGGKGQHHQQHHHVAVALGTARDKGRDRVGHEQTDQRGEHGHAERLGEDLEIHPVAEEHPVALEREAGLLAGPRGHERRESAELARIAQRSHHHDQRRQEEEHHQEHEGRPADQPLERAVRAQAITPSGRRPLRRAKRR